MISKIEISFPVQVEVPKGFNRKLNDLVKEVCIDYEKKNPNRVMWPFGSGSKNNLHANDSRRRKTQIDDSIYCIEVAERQKC